MYRVAWPNCEICQIEVYVSCLSVSITERCIAMWTGLSCRVLYGGSSSPVLPANTGWIIGPDLLRLIGSIVNATGSISSTNSAICLCVFSPRHPHDLRPTLWQQGLTLWKQLYILVTSQLLMYSLVPCHNVASWKTPSLVNSRCDTWKKTPESLNKFSVQRTKVFLTV